MVATLSQPAQLAAGAGASGIAAGAGARGAIGQPKQSVPSVAAAHRAVETHAIYENVSEFIRKEPAQSTRILESWITEPVEESD
jgi:hypothetical protein